jgi:hypothetical protein
MFYTVLSTLSEIHTNPINNHVNLKQGFLMSKQVGYIGLVTTVIECWVLKLTEEATHIFEKGAKKKIEKQFWSLTHSQQN